MADQVQSRPDNPTAAPRAHTSQYLTNPLQLLQVYSLLNAYHYGTRTTMERLLYRTGKAGKKKRLHESPFCTGEKIREKILSEWL